MTVEVAVDHSFECRIAPTITGIIAEVAVRVPSNWCDPCTTINSSCAV